MSHASRLVLRNAIGIWLVLGLCVVPDSAAAQQAPEIRALEGLVEVVSEATLEPGADKNAAERQEIADEQQERRLGLMRTCIAHHRAVVQAHVTFAVKVCECSDVQAEQLRESAMKSLQKAAEKFAAAQMNSDQHHNIRVLGNGRAHVVASEYVDVRAIVLADLQKAVQDLLSKEQLDTYLREIRQRREHRMEAAIDVVVSELDEQLILNEQQRAQIREAFRKQPMPNMFELVQSMLHNNINIMTSIEDVYVQPFVTPAQAAVFQQVKSRRHHGQVFFPGGGQGVFLDIHAGVPFGDDHFHAEAVQIVDEIITAVEVEEPRPAEVEEAQPAETEGGAAEAEGAQDQPVEGPPAGDPVENQRNTNSVPR
jgi:hypothetical protein